MAAFKHTTVKNNIEYHAALFTLLMGWFPKQIVVFFFLFFNMLMQDCVGKRHAVSKTVKRVAILPASCHWKWQLNTRELKKISKITNKNLGRL